MIHELSKHLADLIAAGEVVERPASVAKELIENAIDAGSSRITIEIRDGGRTYLKITDNGCGMSAQDAPIAFRRHATSKLRTKEDLECISTLGFRGEALAAIASVSRIDLFTKQANTLAGVHLHLEAGEILEQEEAGCPDGTTIVIRDLFFNTPARMKFLKKDFTEAGYIISVVEHAALSHPEIAFTLIRDNKTVFSSDGKGKLISPVFSVFGKDLTGNLIELHKFERENIGVWGYISKPFAVRSNRGMQHFFVNGRYIKSTVMQAAFEEAYRNKIIVGKYPSCAIFLSIPFSAVDVNVHPAKTEVKFANEKEVFQAIYIACKNALEQNENIPQIKAKDIKPIEEKLEEKQTVLPSPQPVVKPKQEQGNSEKIGKQQEIEKPQEKKEKYPIVNTCQVMGKTIKVRSIYPDKEPFSLRQNQPKKPYVNADELDWDYLPQIVPSTVQEELKQSVQGGARVLGEAFQTYIVAQDEQGIFLIDKHAAHERMIFNQLRENVDIPRQTLLSDNVIEVTSVEATALLEHIDKVRKLGFDIEVFGQNSFIIREIPAYLDCANLQEVLSQMADKLINHRIPVPDQFDALIHTVACKAAIKAGKDTSMQEMQDFCNRVLADPDVVSCPHGRPIMIRLTKHEIDKMFKRVNQ